jgi:hypothetical protein
VPYAGRIDQRLSEGFSDSAEFHSSLGEKKGRRCSSALKRGWVCPTEFKRQIQTQKLMKDFLRWISTAGEKLTKELRNAPLQREVLG